MGTSQSRQKTADAVSRFQQETNMVAVPARELERVFRRFATHGALSPEAFNFALGALEQFGLRKVSRTPLAAQLFRVFDQDKNGMIDLEEFLAGAALLAGGSLEEKAEVTFRAFDTDGS
ncbi:MAG: EF-hand domain-containing protein, partial [Candidatus Moraniibacteriota bacterium]